MLRRLLPAVALGAVLLVPSASLGAAQTASISGVLTRAANGVKIVLKNNGPDTTAYVLVVMPSAVKHTGVSAVDGGAGPGPDDHSVLFARGLPTLFQPGATLTGTILTSIPYPTGAGADLFTRSSPLDPWVPAGKATGPPAPPAPCKCTSLTARILPKSLELWHPQADLELELELRWTIKCAQGDGGCARRLILVAPQQKANKRTGDQGYSTFWEKPHGTWAGRTEQIACKGSCAESTSDEERYWLGADERLGPDGRAGETLPILVRRTCQGKALPPVRLSIAFDRNGKVDVRKSKLG